VQDHPELRIIEDELWQAVQARLALLGERFGDGVPGHPGAAAHVAYSPHLLAGLLRCGVCGARMRAASYTRRKDERAYTYHWYICGFAKEKGPAVCTHRIWYRRPELEGALLARFREATTPPMLDALARAVRALIDAALQGRDERVAGVKAELLRLEREAAHLVGFLKAGRHSPTIWAELEATETAIEALRAELAALEPQDRVLVPRVHPEWVRAKVTELDTLVQEDPVRARLEIMKHLEGDLEIRPLPAEAGQRRAEITGRVNASSLLAEEEAAFLRLVAGAGFEPATFGL
jgi:hypothetical protein